MIDRHPEGLRRVEAFGAQMFQEPQPRRAVHVERAGEPADIVDRRRLAPSDAEGGHRVQVEPGIVIRAEHERDPGIERLDRRAALGEHPEYLVLVVRLLGAQIEDRRVRRADEVRFHFRLTSVPAGASRRDPPCRARSDC